MKLDTRCLEAWSVTCVLELISFFPSFFVLGSNGQDGVQVKKGWLEIDQKEAFWKTVIQIELWRLRKKFMLKAYKMIHIYHKIYYNSNGKFRLNDQGQMCAQIEIETFSKSSLFMDWNKKEFKQMAPNYE